MWLRLAPTSKKDGDGTLWKPPKWTSEFAPVGFLIPQKIAAAALDICELRTETDRTDRLNAIWGHLHEVKLGSQANPLTYPGPQALDYNGRQRFRRAVRLLVDLDSVMDASRNEEGRSEQGSETIQELLESIRSGQKEGKEAAAETLKRDFLSSFEEGRVQRYAAEYMNPEGHPAISAEFEAAFEKFCLGKDEEEKRNKVNSSKEAIFEVLAAEFPSEIKFLSSYDTDTKQQRVNEAAVRSRTVRARMEALKAKDKPVSAKGISASLGAVLKAGGNAALDTFSDLVEAYGEDLQEGTRLRADMAQEASIGGAFAVASLQKDTDAADPLVGQFIAAVKQPVRLITANESAALGLFSDSKIRSQVKRKLMVLKQGGFLLGMERDHCDLVILVYCKHLTKAGMPLKCSTLIDIAGLPDSSIPPFYTWYPIHRNRPHNSLIFPIWIHRGGRTY